MGLSGFVETKVGLLINQMPRSLVPSDADPKRRFTPNGSSLIPFLDLPFSLGRLHGTVLD